MELIKKAIITCLIYYFAAGIYTLAADPVDKVFPHETINSVTPSDSMETE